MEYKEAKDKFIQSWGVLGKNWGINRTMAQVHALLLISPESLSAEEIMAELNISRGNANMNVRALMDWGMVKKVVKPGERKEFFYADKDIWALAKQVMIERRKREIDPLLSALQEIKDIDESGPEAETLTKVTEDFEAFADRLTKMADVAIKSDEHWFLGTVMKLMK
ncbi:MAG: transcriptional regulator [Schleiferiaceae bacterium]|jgi:DNA-binding transcriptional regulator GbsR (MarR family)|nr:transcriptional regulator [Schleiferiaceae bacterium]